jgi:hypothetical protein
VAALRCATCGQPIEDPDMGLVRAIEKGSRPIRRGSFAFVHKGACDIPQSQPGARVPDWELASMVRDPSQVRFLIRDAFEGTEDGDVCLSDETLVAVVRALDPGYPVDQLREQIARVRCGAASRLT